MTRPPGRSPRPISFRVNVISCRVRCPSRLLANTTSKRPASNWPRVEHGTVNGHVALEILRDRRPDPIPPGEIDHPNTEVLLGLVHSLGQPRVLRHAGPASNPDDALTAQPPWPVSTGPVTRPRLSALVHDSGVRVRGGRPDWMDEVESPSHVQDTVPRPELGRL